MKPIYIGTFLILLVPFVAMFFSDEVQWGPLDFVVIGALLIGAGALYRWIAARVKPGQRWIVAGFVILGVLAIWAEMAVGAIEQLMNAVLV